MLFPNINYNLIKGKFISVGQEFLRNVPADTGIQNLSYISGKEKDILYLDPLSPSPSRSLHYTQVREAWWIGTLYLVEFRARICKRLRSPGIDSKASLCSLVVPVRQIGVVVPVRQAGNRFLDSVYKFELRYRTCTWCRGKRNVPR
jgi:hypothetical protein